MLSFLRLTGLVRGFQNSGAIGGSRKSRFASTISSSPTIAIVGSTGAVGEELLKLMSERSFPSQEIKLLASARSAGKQVEYNGRPLVVEELTADSFDGVDIAFFSAGGERSVEFAPRAVEAGAVVIDNSSAFRMTEGVPLVIPEVNPGAAFSHTGIIANPNCSTVILAMAVWPLHARRALSRIVVSTYQAASGAGASAMEELQQQAVDWSAGAELQTPIFGRQYLWNVFSHNSPVCPQSLMNEEEDKMVKETRKIFGAPHLGISATCVRVPVLRAHCESINLTFASPLPVSDARHILSQAPGVQLLDDVAGNRFPEPLLVSGKDDCYVGRLRPDSSQPEGLGLDMFVAADQIRKGAALNAVQIAELLIAGEGSGSGSGSDGP